MRLDKNDKRQIVLTTPQLRKLCDQAEKLKFSNGPNEHFWQTVDPDGIHVVGMWFIHQPCLAFWEGIKHEWDFTHGGGKNIRAIVQCKMLGTMEPCYLKCDFDYEAFMKLPRTSIKGKSRRTSIKGTSRWKQAAA